MQKYLLAPTPVSQWVSGSVIDSFRFGDSYRISELCELVVHPPLKNKWISTSKRSPKKTMISYETAPENMIVQVWIFWWLTWGSIWIKLNFQIMTLLLFLHLICLGAARGNMWWQNYCEIPTTFHRVQNVHTNYQFWHNSPLSSIGLCL